MIREAKRQMPRRRVVLVFLAIAVATVLASFATIQPAQAAFPGKNGKIAFRSVRDGNEEIYVMNQDGSNQKNLTSNSKTDRDPSWSRDGKKIAFTSFRDGTAQIFVMTKDGSNPVNISNDPAAFDETPYWSPDGKKIVFVSFRDSNNGGSLVGDVYVMDTDPTTDDATNLTNTPGDEFDPAYSPDGKKIVFEDFQAAGRGEIFTMNPDGSDPTNLTNSILSEDFTANFSPSGKKIAFSSFRDGNSEVYVMNADGNNQTRLTNNTTGEVFPVFSPNGRKIVFQSDRDGNKDIFTMNADGTGQTNLTKLSPKDDTQPDWQPIKR